MKRYALLLAAGLILFVLAGCSIPTITPASTPTSTSTEIFETPELHEEIIDIGPPDANILSPPSGSTFPLGEMVLVTSRTLDEGPGISRVDLLVNGETVDSDQTPEGIPQDDFSIIQTWIPEAAGEYIVSVIAFRPDGAPSVPAMISVSIQPVDTSSEEGEEQSEQVCMVTARTRINMRSLPETSQQIRDVLPLGEKVPVTGKLADGSWLQVFFNGRTGWIFAELTYQEGDCDAVRVVDVSIPVSRDTQTAIATVFGTYAVTPTPDGTFEYLLTPDLTHTATNTFTPTTTSQFTPTFTFTPTRTPTPTFTHTFTFTPTRTPTQNFTPTFTFTPTRTPTPTFTHTFTFTPTRTPTTNFTLTFTPTRTPTPTLNLQPTLTFTRTPTPSVPTAPPDNEFNTPLNVPLDSSASSTDFVSYPDGDTTDRVRYDVTGLNSNSALPGGWARLTITASCFGTGTANINFTTGGQTFKCGQTIVNRLVTADSRTGTIVIEAVGGTNTYVQWVLSGSAQRE
jgi:hypothetical protein